MKIFPTLKISSWRLPKDKPVLHYRSIIHSCDFIWELSKIRLLLSCIAYYQAQNRRSKEKVAYIQDSLLPLFYLDQTGKQLLPLGVLIGKPLAELPPSGRSNISTVMKIFPTFKISFPGRIP